MSLVDKILQHDRKTVKELYERIGPKILGHVIKNSGSREEGEELFQITYLKVWEKLEKGAYKEGGRFDQFFMRTAVFSWMEELRKRSGNPNEISEKVMRTTKDTTELDISEAIVKDNYLNALHLGIKQLDQKCKDIIEDFHLKSIPLKELPEVYGISYAGVRKRIHDCRGRLKVISQKILSNN